MGRLGLMEASWSGLGTLLERSWAALGPKKTNLDRLLAGPRAPRRPVSNGLGAKLTSKRGSQRVPKLAPKPKQAENVKTTKKADTL